MHSTDNLDDSYQGSGKILWHSIRKHGKENHKTEILEFLDDRQSLREREEEIVNEKFIGDKLCMNLQLGGGGGWINAEHQLKCSIAGSANNLRDREIYSKALKKCWQNSEYRHKVVTSLKGRPPTDGMLGRQHSEETKLKMRDSGSGKRNSQYGSFWITDGIKNRKMKTNDTIPNTWRRGRK